jgi:hypothetical protein
MCWFSWSSHSFVGVNVLIRVPGAVELFEYVVMTFGLKNAGATYQCVMNYIYHDLIGKLVEICIDDVVVKSTSTGGT